MNNHELEQLIAAVANGTRTPDSVAAQIADATTTAITGETGAVEARIDHDRAGRCGFPEVIFSLGKTPAQVAMIAEELLQRSEMVLATRATPEHFAEVKSHIPSAHYHEIAHIIEISRAHETSYPRKSAAENSRDTAPHIKIDDTPTTSAGDTTAQPRSLISKKSEAAQITGIGLIVVACAGTADISVAEEAAITAEKMGGRVERLYDVGVAGVHRALAHTELLQSARVIIAVAGMEGALPSLVAGLVNVPVIAVPTSVGYGAHFAGVAPLLTMLNSCAGGIGVVNIDNGFGAAVLATRINNPAWSHHEG